MTALLLILGAIAARLLALYHAGQGMMAMARAAENPAERLPLHQVASWYVHQSGVCDLIGLGCFALAVGSWLVSCRHRERGSQGLLLVLHVLFGLLLLLMV